jgi:hypothetical protein
VEFLDAHRKLNFMTLSEADEIGALDPVPPLLRHKSFHLILPDKGVVSGAEALPSLIALFPSGKLASGLITSSPGGTKLLEFAYSAFSRLHDAGSCKYVHSTSGRRADLNHLARDKSRGATGHNDFSTSAL